MALLLFDACRIVITSITHAQSRKRTADDTSNGVKELVDQLSALDPVLRNLKFGRTMILYRANENRLLERARSDARNSSVLICQKTVRGWLARIHIRVIKAARDGIRAAISARDLDSLIAAMDNARSVGWVHPLQKEGAQLEERLVKERDVRQSLERLLPLDSVEHFDAYDEALSLASQLVRCHRHYVSCLAAPQGMRVQAQ